MDNISYMTKSYFLINIDIPVLTFCNRSVNYLSINMLIEASKCI